MSREHSGPGDALCDAEPARRRGAWPVLIALLAALLLPALLRSTENPAYATSASGRSSTLAIHLTSLTPKAPQPRDTLRLKGTVRNTSAQPVFDARAVLRLGAQIRTRGRLAAYARGGSREPAPGQVLSASRVSLRPSHLGSGKTASFRIAVPMDDDTVHAILTGGGAHPATAAGVYELAVAVNGRTASEPAQHPLGLRRTFLPWDPVGNPDLPHPTLLAWRWPLTDRPHRAASTTFRDDALAPSMRPGGRLSVLVGAAAHAAGLPERNARPAAPAHGGHPAHRAQLPSRPVPVTWLIDPMLVDDAKTMTQGYQVRDQDGKHPKGARAAQHWLGRLTDAVQHATVIALPYADPDVVALERHDVDSRRVLPSSRDASLVAGDLAVKPRTRAAAPPDGLAGAAVIRRVAARGGHVVLLSTRAKPQLTDSPYTPGAHVRLAAGHRRINGVLADARLTKVIGAGAADPGRSRAAEQRFLAETLLITGEMPSKQRTVVAAPPWGWRPPARYARALLDDTGTVPWLKPVTLNDVLARAPSTSPRAEPRVPKHLTPPPLPGSYLRPVQQLRRRLGGLAALITPARAESTGANQGPPGPAVGKLSRAIDRTESVAWRGRPGRATTVRAAVAGAVTHARRQVQIASQPEGRYLLSSRTGKIAVSVANKLAQPVTVLVSVDAGSSAIVDRGHLRRMTIPAHTVRTENVRLRARTSGAFPVTLSLHPPDHPGRLIGLPVRIHVHSSSYGGIALGITVGALALLFVAVLLRLIRRVRRRTDDPRAGAAAPDGDGGASAHPRRDRARSAR